MKGKIAFRSWVGRQVVHQTTTALSWDPNWKKTGDLLSKGNFARAWELSLCFRDEGFGVWAQLPVCIHVCLDLYSNRVCCLQHRDLLQKHRKTSSCRALPYTSVSGCTGEDWQMAHKEGKRLLRCKVGWKKTQMGRTELGEKHRQWEGNLQEMRGSKDIYRKPNTTCT